MASSGAEDAWLQQLSDSALTRLSGSAVFPRGQTYAASGAIDTLADAPPQPGEQAALQAVVHGAQAYQVRVWIDDEDELHGACDCPHARDGNFCKHLVALCLAWRGALGGSAPALDQQAARKVAAAAKRARTQASKRDALQQFVQGQSTQELARRLWAWAERDRDCMAELKAWAASANAGDDPKALRSTLTELLRERRDFLDWRGSSAYAQRASAILPLLAPWQAGDAATGRQLCEHALRCLYKVARHADDSNGDLGGLVQQVMELLMAMLRAAPPAGAWLDDWFKLMAQDPWGLWDERAVLLLAGPAVQARYAERVRGDWEDWQRRHPRDPQPKTVDRYGGYDPERHALRRRYLNSIAAQDDPRALADAMGTSAESGVEYGELIALCVAQGWHREALQWAEAGHKRHPRDMRLEELLLDCYERDGWDEEALALRRVQLERRPSPATYMAALQAAQRAGRQRADYRAELFAWAEQREQEEIAAERKRPAMWRGSGPVVALVTVRVAWLLAERDLPAALALARQPGTACGADTLVALARVLPAERRAEAAQLLQRVFGSVMPPAQSPYARPLELVREIVALLPVAEGHAWLASLRDSYKAKRNFIAGLPTL